jgi:hypothetical protein
MAIHGLKTPTWWPFRKHASLLPRTLSLGPSPQERDDLLMVFFEQN